MNRRARTNHSPLQMSNVPIDALRHVVSMFNPLMKEDALHAARLMQVSKQFRNLAKEAGFHKKLPTRRLWNYLDKKTPSAIFTYDEFQEDDVNTKQRGSWWGIYDFQKDGVHFLGGRDVLVDLKGCTIRYASFGVRGDREIKIYREWDNNGRCKPTRALLPERMKNTGTHIIYVLTEHIIKDGRIPGCNQIELKFENVPIPYDMIMPPKIANNISSGVPLKKVEFPNFNHVTWSHKPNVNHLVKLATSEKNR